MVITVYSDANGGVRVHLGAHYRDTFVNEVLDGGVQHMDEFGVRIFYQATIAVERDGVSEKIHSCNPDGDLPGDTYKDYAF
jgi:hypothetical protein